MQSSNAFIPKYSALVYNGFWFSPEREALQALITESQREVTGVVTLKLYKGNVIAQVAEAEKVFTIQRLRRWKARHHHTIRATRVGSFD